MLLLVGTPRFWQPVSSLGMFNSKLACGVKLGPVVDCSKALEPGHDQFREFFHPCPFQLEQKLQEAGRMFGKICN